MSDLPWHIVQDVHLRSLCKFLDPAPWINVRFCSGLVPHKPHQHLRNWHVHSVERKSGQKISVKTRGEKKPSMSYLKTKTIIIYNSHMPCFALRECNWKRQPFLLCPRTRNNPVWHSSQSNPICIVTGEADPTMTRITNKKCCSTFCCSRSFSKHLGFSVCFLWGCCCRPNSLISNRSFKSAHTDGLLILF